MKQASLTVRTLTVATLILFAGSVYSQESWDGNRWFQIEVSIFSSAFSSDLNAERWTPEHLKLTYPARIRPLLSLSNFLYVEDLRERLLGIPVTATYDAALENAAELLTAEQRYIDAMGPFPASGSNIFRLPDLERDAFLLLPAAQSEFQQTNRALERSAQNRLLFHGLWRQPVLLRNAAVSVFIAGGRQYGTRHELEGSLTFRFNAGSDRVVIDSNLWFSDYSRVKNSAYEWQVPPVPAAIVSALAGSSSATEADSDYVINRTFQLTESRDMRSNEFHYLDHPAMGLVVSVKPYDLPPPHTLATPQQ